VKINWHSETQLSSNELDGRIKIEFNFRQKMTRFLMRHSSLDCCEDFSCYVFDYFVDNKNIAISKDTPEPYYSNLKRLWHLFSLD